VKITNNYLFELLKNCDILINLASTVSFEAMAYGKKVIYINTMNIPKYALAPENEDYLKIVSTEKELDKIIKTVLENSNEKTSETIELSKQFIKQKGDPAYTVIIKNIEEMLETE